MNIEQALQNPSGAFRKPDDVLAEPGLSRAQKIQVLRRWEYDARELEVAEEENMGGGPESQLAEVIEALHRLGESPDLRHGSGKQGGH
ncbi:hypothetical protein PVT67_03310 [Gallaecimonas kandeliae]|uniref:hypothetical protein n=1 Tax=Gallaecimonas kandeliae TaxID=3029055 RepID=UPI002648EEA0|nr:hypothetical protein [Gallaecimonas kandeliae]WKE66293.1 hypothetical protein PVT67_03310 [Gallaecimonas kandeliae]